MKIHVVLTKQDADIAAFKKSLPQGQWSKHVVQIMSAALRDRVADIPMCFTIEPLNENLHSHVGKDEIVLAASLWYPWGYREGTIYTEVSKIDIPIKMERPVEFDACLGNYGLLINEQAMDETQDTTIGMGGVSLFNRVCGNLKLYFGNCQVAPASIWRDLFECEPKDNDPYIWVDSSGQEILRFERITSPVREVMREAYIRQPILFRWIGNKDWLKTLLKREHLCLIPFGTQEPYPRLGY